MSPELFLSSRLKQGDTVCLTRAEVEQVLQCLKQKQCGLSDVTSVGIKAHSSLKKKRELASHWGVSVGTIENRMREGMPFIRVGRCVRFDLGEVTAWAERNT